MKSILLIGLGRFGRHIAMKLNELGHEVLAVDCVEERVQKVLDYVTNAQIGDSTNYLFMRSLGVRNFDVCIVAIGDDFQSSLETTSLLSELGAVKVVSRAASDVHEKFLLKNGADEVIYPEKQLAAWSAIRYSSNHVFDYIDLDGDYAIFEISVPEKWVGRTVIQVDIRKKYGINILAIITNDILDPNITANTILRPENNLLVLGTEQAIQKCFKI
ncbi:MAG: TrkA family potassium uptake protein [Ruminococcus sp.]|nr:TrkA family potassium uptake protein [Ruminococcus sp.]MDE6784243.1 TrkA family potassium uptake protein [Ruminococcus sp.]